MKNSTRSTIFIAAIVSLGGFLFGFDASVIAGVTKYIKPEFALTDLQLGWVVSAPTFSAMFAMLVAGAVSDIVGRKKVLIVVAFLYAISAIWSANAGGYTDLVIARMLGGIAFGSALVLAPVYIAEIAPCGLTGKIGFHTAIKYRTWFFRCLFQQLFFAKFFRCRNWFIDH